MAVTLRELTREEYENLALIKGNRPVNTSYTRKKRREIEHNNCILQRKEWMLTINDRNEIVDGQAHWAAILQFNERHPKHPIKTVSCCVEPGTGLNRAKEINNNVHTQWKEKDYFASFIAQGYTDYETLQRYRSTEAGKACGLPIVLRVCGYLEDKDANRKFKNGEFVMVRQDEEDIMSMLSNIARCKSALVRAIGDRSVSIPAFMKCLLILDMDRNMLSDRVNHPPINNRNFRYAFTEEEAVRNIELCYNHRIGASNPARLDIVNRYRDVRSTNWTQQRSATRQPALRIAPTRGAIRHGSLHDNGVVPV